MAVPDFQSIMLPLLEIFKDGEIHNSGELFESLTAKFNLSEEDRKELLPSGRQGKFANRVGWARTYLIKSGLLERIEKGKYKIMERGLNVLDEQPDHINIKYLKRFPELIEFIGGKSPEIEGGEETELTSKTPEEILESGYQQLKKELAQELYEEIRKNTPQFFEKLVIDLLVSMGYGGSRKDAGQAIGCTKDGGIDGIIKEDRLGLDIIYVQAKRWENTVGSPEVQAFAGSIEGHKARKGVFITTSKFSNAAKEFVNSIEKKIILIDGDDLVNLMIDYNVGVTEANKYIVKKVDTDYFSEE